jgi:hypothetical protein
MPRLPHPPHAFFKQAVLEGEVSDNLLEGAGFPAQILDLL